MSAPKKSVVRKPKPKAVEPGRPPTPDGERLESYGLRLSPDKKKKLLEIKAFHGLSVREWIEGEIERAHVAMLETKKRRRLA
jgi:hypothetical protein